MVLERSGKAVNRPIRRAKKIGVHLQLVALFPLQMLELCLENGVGRVSRGSALRHTPPRLPQCPQTFHTSERRYPILGC